MIFTNLVRRYLNLAPALSNTLIQTAYHKSGHIVLAYSYGYSCHRVDLKEIENIDIHYKEDLMLVAGIVSYSIDPMLFDSLPEFHRKRAGVVTERLINMLTAGYLAQQRSEFGEQCLFRAGDHLLQQPPASIDRLTQFQQNLIADASDPFSRAFNVQSLSYFLTRSENWKLVDNLARHLLYAPGNTLDQHAIEKIINRSGAVKVNQSGGALRPIGELGHRAISTSQYL
jgi:hypothetical protein